MKTVTVKHSWFSESGFRFDASFHLSDGVNTKRIIEKYCPYPTTTLDNESEELYKGNIHKRVYVTSPEHGHMFFTASDMFRADIDSGKYISKKYSPHLEELELKKDWILVTRSGTLGKVVYVTEDYDGKIGTDDLVRIKPAENQIKRGYLYAYLSSKHGYGLLTQSGYGGVVKHIEPHHVENIKIPILPEPKQQQIHNLIVEASKLRVEANRLLNEAEDLFNKGNDLQYPPELISISENDIQIGYKVKKSKLFEISIKARNHSLRVRQIIACWESKKGVTLENFLESPFQMGARASFKRITSLNFNGEDLISQGDIHKQNPKTFKQVRIKKLSVDDQAQRASLIMPSAGTLGENEIFTRPLLVRNNFEDKLLSEVIGKFKCRTEIDAAYLFTALSTSAGFRILRGMVYGTNLMYPNWELLKDVNIPLESDSLKKEVGMKVLLAFDKRGEADKKENQAINLIENEIEKWQES